MEAALGAHCAGSVGRFEPYHDYLFSNVDSIGVEPWSSIALKVGIVDTTNFAACLESPLSAEAVNADSVAASGLEIGGTPMVLVNGWRFGGAPPMTTLDSIIRAQGAVR